MIRALSECGSAVPRLRALHGRSSAIALAVVSGGSVRHCCFSQQQQQRKTTTTTNQRTNSHSRSQPPFGWAVAASAALSASLLGAATLCESSPLHHPPQPTTDENNQPSPPTNNSPSVPRRLTTKSGMKDPMTHYQQYAIRREQKEEQAKRQQQHEEQQQQRGLASTAFSSLEQDNNDSNDGDSDYYDEDDSVEDPMTLYQQHAIQRAIEQVDAYQKEQLKQNQEQHAESNEYHHHVPPYSATLQATSPDTNGEQPQQHSPPPLERAFPTEMTASEARLEQNARDAKKHSGGIKVFSGNGNMSLALEITRHLGISLGKATVGRFADGECNVVIKENVRGKDVYVVQPTCPPVNDNLMELLLMVSTLRRASARRITVVIPYYGYARQDRKMQARVPISAADVARLMEAIGVDRVIAVDLHCGQIQGFFGPRVPVDNLDGGIVGLHHFGSKDLHNPVIVSPDAGGVYRAKKFKEGLEQKYDLTDLGLAMIVKQRARAGTVDQMDLVGDVKDCDCIIVDDMIDTAGTLCKAATVLKANGAARVFAFASHGLLSGPGNERIAASEMEEVVVLNTIPTSPQREANEKLTELSVAPLLAQAIFNIHAKKSISALFR